MTLVKTEPDYELVSFIADMTVGLYKGGVRIATCSYHELAAAKCPGDTPEVNFARAVALQRVRKIGIADHRA